MRDEGRVGPFGVTLDSRRPAPLPGLPMVLLQVRDKAALHLRQGLQALFDNADDTLFEMADKAGVGDPQHLYFEAMRDLRLKRKSIERAFLDTLHDTFLQLGQIGRASSCNSVRSTHWETSTWPSANLRASAPWQWGRWSSACWRAMGSPWNN